jgi:phosphatidylserine/phosphatidylglycerophosphate/cardiolipin synthase-like enzyme
VLTEGAIRKGVLQMINDSRAGDDLWVAMFYLSERSVVDALVDAAGRGVAVRCVLDANRDAFGFEKNGIPNRPVAAELKERSGGAVEVRWYLTEGEQYHTKLVFAETPGGSAGLILGSANLTRRNLGDYNLELDLMVSGRGDAAVMRDVRSYLRRIWSNTDGTYTLPYQEFAESSIWKRLVYRFQERTGICSF